MKVNKRIVLTIIAIGFPFILLIFYFTLPSCIEFVPNEKVASSFYLSRELKELLKKGKLDTINTTGTKNKNNYYSGNDAKDIAYYCQRVVADELVFSFKRKADRKSNEQNCVGYAAMLTEACNYIFKINNVDAVCYHVRGSIKYLGMDLCRFGGLFSSFFKDHDFCVVKFGNETIIIDASLYDLTTLF